MIMATEFWILLWLRQYVRRVLSIALWFFSVPIWSGMVLLFCVLFRWNWYYFNVFNFFFTTINYVLIWIFFKREFALLHWSGFYNPSSKWNCHPSRVKLSFHHFCKVNCFGCNRKLRSLIFANRIFFPNKIFFNRFFFPTIFFLNKYFLWTNFFRTNFIRSSLKQMNTEHRCVFGLHFCFGRYIHH